HYLPQRQALAAGQRDDEGRERSAAVPGRRSNDGPQRTVAGPASAAEPHARVRQAGNTLRPTDPVGGHPPSGPADPGPDRTRPREDDPAPGRPTVRSAPGADR